jgi:hypothetical protein
MDRSAGVRVLDDGGFSLARRADVRLEGSQVLRKARVDLFTGDLPFPEFVEPAGEDFA